ncbi:MAG: tRNA (adenosine(37)-N6)-threonylcarbamoyltransferase complex transferase subunit TsaD [Clostridia bacterium]|nr:tRNA (adenosine(37)-N6)-threonylcarbamoyltransferase complex transferase subunit TsaD [Clostridia bacterium]
MNILSFESSCDETAVAIVRDGREVLASTVISQIDIHKVYGGVVPEIASRCHIEKISQLTKECIRQSGLKEEELDAVAVTAAPGLIGALLVGLNFAKGYAYARNLPLIPVHHIRAHVAANYIAHPDLKPPFLAMIVSGGHSHIVLVKNYTDYEILGRTKDDAAGEAFDKGARVLGLPYPGGVHMDRMAKEGNPKAVKFPRVHFKDDPYDFSFSGVKTAIVNYVHNARQKGEELNFADIAASYSDAVTGILAENFLRCARDHGQKTLVIAGGVSANSMLREKLLAGKAKDQVLYMPPLNLCGDNGAMVGAQGYYEFQAGHTAGLDLNALSAYSIENQLC